MNEDKRKTLDQLIENTREQLTTDDGNVAVDPIIISVIRNAMPSLLADTILGVQPMFSPHSKEEWPYQVDVLSSVKYSDIIPMKRWCSETFADTEWTASVQFFAFKTQEHLSWFTLRWL